MLQSSADEVARNGAPLKINFGQRFSWTPLAFFLQLRFKLADKSLPLKLSLQLTHLGQHKSLLDVQSRLPQQSRNNRLFEA
jgi:hypothetical protein